MREQFMSETLITAPGVYLVGYSSMAPFRFEEFLKDRKIDSKVQMSGSHGEGLCEIAGRICYMSFERPRPGGSKDYHQHILEVGHGSVLEHATYNFILDGISRSLSHELVRHRTGVGISQLSQRYVDSEDVAFVVPADAEMRRSYAAARVDPASPEAKLFMIWLDSVIQARRAYGEMVDELEPLLQDVPDRTERRKRARQTARSVLPNATETIIFWTVNFRALRHIIEMRAAGPAETEIRALAMELVRVARSQAPFLFGDYKDVTLADGTKAVETPYRKV